MNLIVLLDLLLVEEENKMNYKLNDIVIMKKEHPCGNNEFRIVRVGTDIKIECLKCGRLLLIPRVEFNKKIKKVISDV